MSMHDIEAVVECSVYCIDDSDLSLEEKRDLLYNLYNFQAQWDTGYTHFRVKDILLKYNYLFALPIEKHPDYAARKEEFDALVENDYAEWLTDDSFYDGNGDDDGCGCGHCGCGDKDADECSCDGDCECGGECSCDDDCECGGECSCEDGCECENHDDGCGCGNDCSCTTNTANPDNKNLFYCDAGSKTWQQLVDNGTLTGVQALPVKEMPLYDVILKVAALCRELEDADCAAQWYATLIGYELWDATDDDRAVLDEIAKILWTPAVFSALQNDFYFMRGLEGAKAELDEVPPIAKEWLTAYLDWEQKMEQDPNAILERVRALYVSYQLDDALVLTEKGLSIAPDNAFLRLYESIIHIMMMSVDPETKPEQYEPWMEKLSQLGEIKTDNPETDKVIQSHSLYYMAMAEVFRQNFDKALEIADKLKTVYEMKEADELLNFIDEFKKYLQE
ncbi:hypothetical protein MsAg5_02510 [Methanosarcinaceae archaeon Ag5]|uniref:Uncharacterized protein n=1 Tax=Methanolapillus africanus TaxID=3028297 RepID=A0AAE4MJQ8_9EURY|nr:hypothetical protein [Methanosarcinaceae archaeon Ag5]